MSDPRLSFKEMCTKYDVTPRTLRYYEYIELLSPDREGRTRLFSLEDIRQWLLIYAHEGTDAQMRQWIALADRQITELLEQQKQLRETLVELQSLRDETAASLA